MTQKPLSRRQFAKLTAGVAGAGVLAGCTSEPGTDTDASDGGSDGSSDGNGGSSDGSSDDTGSPYGEITGPYRLRMWHEKYGNTHIGKFADKYGIEATNKGISSQSGIYAKIQADQYVGDNISFIHNWGQRAWENDLLQPIDTTKLQHLDNLDDRWQTLNQVGENEQWGIPYDVDIFPLAYNTDVIPSAPTSWGILWDSEYEGKITMQDSAITGCQIAALYTGQDPINPSDFKDIEEALMQQKPLVKSYWGTFERGMRLFVNEAVIVGQLTVGRVIQADLEHGAPIDYTVPEEGGMTYFDEFTIPHNGENVNTSYAWMDDYLRHGGPIFTKLEKYRATTEGLVDKLPPDLAERLEWPQEWKLIPQELLDPEVRKKYEEIWTRLKA